MVDDAHPRPKAGEDGAHHPVGSTPPHHHRAERRQREQKQAELQRHDALVVAREGFEELLAGKGQAHPGLPAEGSAPPPRNATTCAKISSWWPTQACPPLA